MIRPLFSITNTERASPKIALDFTAGALGPRVTFTRAGNTATRVNSSGFVELIVADTPRFDYDPVTLAARGLFIEEQRTNLFKQSEQLNTTPWARIVSAGLSVTQNDGISPTNSQTASLLNDLASGSATNHGVQQTGLSISANTIYVLSVYAKDVDRGFITTSLTTVASNYASVEFDLTGTVNRTAALGTGYAVVSSSIEDAGNGWYRCIAVLQTGSVAVTDARTQISLSDGSSAFANRGSVFYLGNNKTAYIWGCQLEEASIASSYIPTETTTVTRNADVATITGADFDGFWRAGKGAALVKARPSTVSSIRPVLQFDDTTANNIIALRGNAANPELYVRTGGVDQAQTDAGTIAANASYRLAGAWATNDCAASFNSGAPVLDGVATISTVTQARLGSDGTNYLNGHIEAIEYYDERLPSASLQVLSSQAGSNSIIGSVFRDSIIS